MYKDLPRYQTVNLPYLTVRRLATVCAWHKRSMVSVLDALAKEWIERKGGLEFNSTPITPSLREYQLDHARAKPIHMRPKWRMAAFFKATPARPDPEDPTKDNDNTIFS